MAFVTSMNDEQQIELARQLSHALHCIDNRDAALAALRFDCCNGHAFVEAVKREHPDVALCTSAKCNQPDGGQGTA